MSTSITIEPAASGSVGDAPRSQQHSPVRYVGDYIEVTSDALRASIQHVVDAVAESVKPSKDGPESCQIKFGIKVSGQGNVILARMGSELTLEVTITWKR